VWCEDQSLKVAFLELFSIACFKDAFVSDHLEISTDSHQWNVSFIRDREVDFFTSFFTMLYSFRLRWEGEDKLYLALYK
jgi:hypothetical protein